MADTYDLIVLGSGPGGYVAAIRAAQLGPQDRDRRARECWAASASTGAASRPRRCCARPRSSTTCSHAEAYGLGDGEAELRPRQGRRAQPRGRQAAQPGRHGPDEEEQDHRAHGRRASSPRKGKLTVTSGRQDDRARRQAHHHRHRRPRPRPAVRQGRRQAHLDLSPRDDPAGDADQAAGHRLGRDRDRVRQLLQRHGRRGDGGRDARPRSCRSRMPRSRAFLAQGAAPSRA